jgi:ATP-dependent Zn protease
MNYAPKQLTRPLVMVFALLLLLALAPSQAAALEQNESEASFRQQLANGAIQQATINRLLRRVHLVLKDGQHIYFRYPPHHQEPRVVAELKAKRVPVVIEKSSQAKIEAKAVPRHHKLRYIVGGVLIAVIVIVIAVLLVNRRRQRE